MDEEKGIGWDLGFAGDRVKGDYFPRFYANLDLGTGAPHPALVGVAARARRGWSPGDREEPFANFYFGGFRQQLGGLPRREALPRVLVRFPGLEINEVGGTNYAKAMLEWNLPPAPLPQRRQAGLLPHVGPARPLRLRARDQPRTASDFRRTITNVGGQVDFRLGVLSRLELTLSAGYARAFEDGAFPRDEAMVSLKVLR